MGKVHNRTGRTRLTYLVIAGLVVQLFVAGLYAPAMAFRSAAATDDDARKVLICSGAGFKAITLDDRGRQAKSPADTENAAFCPICLGLANCYAIEPSSIPIGRNDIPPPPRLSAIVFSSPANGRPERPTSRGPPA